MIKYYTGNTIVIPVEIESADPNIVLDLVGANIIFSAINLETGAEVRKEPVVEGNKVTATLEAEETLVPGVYSLEFRGNFSGIVKTIKYDRVLLSHANIKEVIPNG